MGDIDIVQTSRHRHWYDLAARGCINPHEETVVRIVNDAVTVNLWSHAVVIRRKFTRQLVPWRVEICLAEGVGVSRYRRVGAVGDGIEGDCRTGLRDVDGVDDLLL